MPSAPNWLIRTCKSLERFAERLTGAAGPVLIAVGVTLLAIGTVSFFDVVEPKLPYRIVLTPICALIAVNMFTNYYYACTISPGFTPGPVAPGARGQPQGDAVPSGEGWNWAPQKHQSWGPEVVPARVTVCKRCGGRKPERTHHCRICNRCVMKYDHHCPWINQCVGIYNERHFILFMAYLAIATWSFMISGYSEIWNALGWTKEWNHSTPSVMFILSYILSVAIGFAITVMCSWSLWGVAVGETSVESQDFEYYRRIAKERGETFVNAYDLGRRRNLELFFNIGPQGAYPWWSLLLPLRALPYTDGTTWARRLGENVGIGFRPGEEVVTDEDE